MTCSKCSAPLLDGAVFCETCGAAVQAEKPKDPLLGRTLLNQYVIQKKLGEGGFGAVYIAEQPSMGRKVAIKTLHRHMTFNPEIVARFKREGMVASRLEHPNAVKMLNLGETEDGILWIAMEFLDGETLESKVKKRGPISPEELVELMGPVCEVLGEAHQKGIVHRDLKPENIMLVPYQGKTNPKILDFGIAGLLVSEENRTAVGLVSGTPQYMSPEQWQGLRNTDARSDIYSLGIIAYMCLSGKLPFHATTAPQWMQKHCFESPIELTQAVQDKQISSSTAAVIMKALAKDPAARYQTTAEFYRALKGSLSDVAFSGAQTMPPSGARTDVVVTSPVGPAPKVSSKSKAPLLVGAAALVLIPVGLFLGGVFNKAPAGPVAEPNEPATKPIDPATKPAPTPSDEPWSEVEGDWSKTVIGDTYGETLYTVEADGRLFSTNLTTNAFSRIGTDVFPNIRIWVAGKSFLCDIDKDGSLYVADAVDGSWRRLGKVGSWKNTKVGASIGDSFYSIEADGRLFVTNLHNKDDWSQFGTELYPDAKSLVVMDGALFLVTESGSLDGIMLGDATRVKGEPLGLEDVVQIEYAEKLLYYRDSAGHLYMFDKSSKRKELLVSDSAGVFAVTKERLYYVNTAGKMLYKKRPSM